MQVQAENFSALSLKLIELFCPLVESRHKTQAYCIHMWDRWAKSKLSMSNPAPRLQSALQKKIPSVAQLCVDSVEIPPVKRNHNILNYFNTSMYPKVLLALLTIQLKLRK